MSFFLVDDILIIESSEYVESLDFSEEFENMELFGLLDELEGCAVVKI